jgi:TetR/AcrR family transcriptional regulator, regulator of autoinduction and epiphytic fitness
MDMGQPDEHGQHDEQGAGHEQSDGADRQGQILEAAFEEFASQGFRGATIKRIAQRARLASQALIYWYFPTKEALFQAVLERRLPILRAVGDPAALLDRPPREALSLLAGAYLETTSHPAALRLLRLFAPEALRRPEIADLIGSRIIGRVLAFLEGYFAHQVELGRLRSHDVRISARAFVGMALPRLGGKMLFHALEIEGVSDEAYVDAIVSIFLEGLRPLSGPGSGAKHD